MEKIIFATNTQKALNFLISAHNGEIERAEIEKKTGLSKAGVNFALKELVQSGLIAKTEKGKVYLYNADFSHPAIKQLKALKTIIKIFPLIKKIKPLAQKIILFGSSGRGENLPESDIDLFILTRNAETIKNIIKKNKSAKNIQCIFKTPMELAGLQKQDPYFYQEIDRGIALWESYE